VKVHVCVIFSIPCYSVSHYSNIHRLPKPLVQREEASWTAVVRIPQVMTLGPTDSALSASGSDSVPVSVPCIVNRRTYRVLVGLNPDPTLSDVRPKGSGSEVFYRCMQVATLLGGSDFLRLSSQRSALYLQIGHYRILLLFLRSSLLDNVSWFI
jgi:hypothetical protein